MSIFVYFTVHAAGTETETPALNAQYYYDEAKKSLENDKWKPALVYLKKAYDLDSKNADINNLLGYGYRKSGDYQKALHHYALALQINPKHTGAIEYRGETYLLLNRLADAEQALIDIEKICMKECADYRELASAIRDYKKSH